MRSKLLIKSLLATALLLMAIPAVASAQIYNRYDRYDQSSRWDIRQAIARLDNSSSRLESDLNVGRERTVLGGLLSFRTVDNQAVMEVRDFRSAVRDLRRASRNGASLESSVDEARYVLNRGVQLDRYLRLRTGRASVDDNLADLRSNLHVIADAYGLNMPY